jgi:hypothetical protein
MCPLQPRSGGTGTERCASCSSSQGNTLFSWGTARYRRRKRARRLPQPCHQCPRCRTCRPNPGTSSPSTGPRRACPVQDHRTRRTAIHLGCTQGWQSMATTASTRRKRTCGPSARRNCTTGTRSARCSGTGSAQPDTLPLAASGNFHRISQAARQPCTPCRTSTSRSRQDCSRPHSPTILPCPLPRPPTCPLFPIHRHRP